MKFCPECGTKIEGMKFCPECGYRVVDSEEISAPRHAAQAIPIPYSQQSDVHEQVLVKNNQNAAGIDDEKVLMEFQTYLYGLEDKKQNVGGKFDVSIPIVKYTLTTERIIAEKQSAVSAMSSKARQEIELIYIDSVEVKKGIVDRVANKGDVILFIGGKKTALKSIRDSEQVRNAIRAAVGKRKKLLEAQSKVEYKKFM